MKSQIGAQSFLASAPLPSALSLLNRTRMNPAWSGVGERVRRRYHFLRKTYANGMLPASALPMRPT